MRLLRFSREVSFMIRAPLASTVRCTAWVVVLVKAGLRVDQAVTGQDDLAFRTMIGP